MNELQSERTAKRNKIESNALKRLQLSFNYGFTYCNLKSTIVCMTI